MEECAGVKVVAKKSRFFARLYHLDDPGEISAILARHRREYKKAAHHCWALRWSASGTVTEESRNDGEVGQPGRILLELLRQNTLDRHALVCSRIFGGVKLGPGGVARAFRDAGAAAVQVMDAKGEEEA